MPKIHKYCKFPGCSSVYRCKESVRFHSFPRHPATLKAWKEICHLDDSANVQHLRICSKHFDNSDYNYYFLKRFLNRKAIPHAPSSKVSNQELSLLSTASGNFLKQGTNNSALSTCFQLVDHDYCILAAFSVLLDHDYTARPPSPIQNEVSSSIPTKLHLDSSASTAQHPSPHFQKTKGTLSKLGLQRQSQRAMVMCWAPDCKHYNVRETCKFYKFPTDPTTRKKWKKLIRRYGEPGTGACVCSCHFVDGKRENYPTIFAHNAGKMFTFVDPEKRTRRKKVEMDVAKKHITCTSVSAEIFPVSRHVQVKSEPQQVIKTEPQPSTSEENDVQAYLFHASRKLLSEVTPGKKDTKE